MIKLAVTSDDRRKVNMAIIFFSYEIYTDTYWQWPKQSRVDFATTNTPHCFMSSFGGNGVTKEIYFSPFPKIIIKVVNVWISCIKIPCWVPFGSGSFTKLVYTNFV